MYTIFLKSVLKLFTERTVSSVILASNLEQETPNSYMMEKDLKEQQASDFTDYFWGQMKDQFKNVTLNGLFTVTTDNCHCHSTAKQLQKCNFLGAKMLTSDMRPLSDILKLIISANHYSSSGQSYWNSREQSK